MQIEKAMRHVLRFRPRGCCFGGFLKGYLEDENLSEQERMAKFVSGGGHELCEKILRFIRGLEKHNRLRLREDIRR